jgi:site-specific DNA-methyltransferase (adenine-specific)
MEFMKDVPDKFIDLCIVDPPYGINHAEIAGKQSNTQYGKAAAPKKEYTIKLWDKSIPDKLYFDELFRISKNQIIWGGNNFSLYLPFSTGWIFWDKDNGSNGFSDGELAFTNFKKGLRKFKYTWNGMIQEDMKNKQERIHPTQKPIQLYQWLLQNYSQKGDKIFDSHVGSASSLIACHLEGFEYVGCELDPDYYKQANERLEAYKAQGSLFNE